MPLTLVTGAANAAKAGEVLGRFRAALPREPVLVVPTSADVDHYMRELAEAGIVLGAEVVTFTRLIREIAREVGIRTRVVGPVARDRVVRAAIGDVRLDALAISAAAPGFAESLADFFAELGNSLIAPARFARAVKEWEDAPAHASELAQLLLAYHRRLANLDRLDTEGYARAALDGLRAAPAAWRARPVFLYGFDDLTPLQADAVETLARGADVTVALPYEPGRHAFAGRAGTVEALRPLADDIVHLQERSDHYAEPARGALHHLERSLFEPGAARVSPNGAVRLLEAGGERAEAELVAAAVLELLGRGMVPDDIAVLVRGGAGEAGTLGRGLAAYGVPVAREQRPRLSATRLGAGLLAAARAARRDGTADDLLRWLRTPGRVADTARLDAFEAHVRRVEPQSAAAARALWPGDAAWLGALDALADADHPAELLDALTAEAQVIWQAPHARGAAVLDHDTAEDARAFAALAAAARELRALGEQDERLLGDVLEAVARVTVRERPAPGGVLLADPLAVRARRFRAVFVCGLQDGEFPRHPMPEPFLDDAARVGLARASGIVLPRHEDVLARERYLLYACASRPEEVLFLSFRSSDEEGDPLVVSPFVDDVRALFTDELWTRRGRRLLAEVTWPAAEAPTPHELRRAQAAAETLPDPAPLGAPATPAVLERLAAHDREPARGVETFAGCGVRWLVERLLKPERTAPDPEPMTRGSLAHATLERTLTVLRERTGSAALHAQSLPAALDALHHVLGELRTSARDITARAGVRTLAADLERYLRHEAECGAGLEPQWLEWSFGGERDEAAALELPGAGLAVTGRVDRIDSSGGLTVIRDYKGKTVYAGARWAEDQRLQVALYAVAVRERLGLEPAGALYQPLGAPDARPRGYVRDDVPGRYVNGDVVDGEALREALDGALALAGAAARDLRAGRIRACPSSCSYAGCAYPGICRASEGTAEAEAAAADAAAEG